MYKMMEEISSFVEFRNDLVDDSRVTVSFSVSIVDMVDEVSLGNLVTE